MNRRQRRHMGVRAPQSWGEWVRQQPEAPIRRRELSDVFETYLREREDWQAWYRRLARWIGSRQVVRWVLAGWAARRTHQQGAQE